jgi:hypothetical protein
MEVADLLNGSDIPRFCRESSYNPSPISLYLGRFQLVAV